MRVIASPISFCYNLIIDKIRFCVNHSEMLCALLDIAFSAIVLVSRWTSESRQKKNTQLNGLLSPSFYFDWTRKKTKSLTKVFLSLENIKSCLFYSHNRSNHQKKNVSFYIRFVFSCVLKNIPILNMQHVDSEIKLSRKWNKMLEFRFLVNIPCWFWVTR